MYFKGRNLDINVLSGFNNGWFNGFFGDFLGDFLGDSSFLRGDFHVYFMISPMFSCIF